MTTVARHVLPALLGLLGAGPLVGQSPAADGGFRPIDVDGDGEPEVRAVRPLGTFGDAASPDVLVLVEDRLLTPRADSAGEAPPTALTERLERFGRDLAAEGHRAVILAVAVYDGPRHQDGRTVLGLRRLLKTHADRRSLAGAVLVGHFPDATLVRTCNWRKKGAIRLPGRDGEDRAFDGSTRWLRRIPELVAHKFDLVLADLDGGWEDLYVGEPTVLERVEAVFADPEHLATGGPCVAMRVGRQSVVDVFHVADGAVAVDPEGLAVTIDDGTRDHECTAGDRRAANAIAHPEIAVSRIDARGAAWSPRAAFVAPSGSPQPVQFDAEDDVPRWDRVWEPDPALELRLLCEYFDRNHRYRTEGIDPAANRPASIAWGLPSGMRSVRRANADWAGFAEPGYDVHREVDLLQLVAWLRRPALVRTLRAHSSGRHAAFAKTDAAALEQAIGGVPWSFSPQGRTLAPSLHSACRSGRAGFFLYRTLWANGALPPDPFLLIHTGCEALSPPHHDRPFDHPSYGARQHAESILFYTPCLAIVGRAKVFYDEPRGFSETLRDGGSVGAAWQHYFDAEGAVESWGRAGGDIGRKRSYFWSLLGDWTLTMPD